jgi:formate hydrogenlyase subunit 4
MNLMSSVAGAAQLVVVVAGAPLVIGLMRQVRAVGGPRRRRSTATLA